MPAVFYRTPPASSDTMDLYAQVREKEERFYSDEQVKALPGIASSHRYAGEWKIRQRTLNSLLMHLKKRRIHTILEVGCGNGWLSAGLARGLPESQVIGLDLNQKELEQAAHVFDDLDNLAFHYGDLFSKPLFEPASLEVIILPSVIQYFPSLGTLSDALLPLLKPGGELHIIDSPVYQETDREAAAERSRTYYEKMGVPGMADHYFHHTMKELEAAFPVKLRKYSYGLFSRHPFPWLCYHHPLTPKS